MINTAIEVARNRPATLYLSDIFSVGDVTGTANSGDDRFPCIEQALVRIVANTQLEAAKKAI